MKKNILYYKSMSECLHLYKNGNKCNKKTLNGGFLCSKHKEKNQKGGGKYKLDNSIGLSALGLLKFNKKIENIINLRKNTKNKK